MAAASKEMVRVGLMGTAGIATKNFFAVLASESCQFLGVASRNLGRAKEWAAQHASQAVAEGYPIEADKIRCYGSYDDLLADSDIDVVYCPLPTALHDEWAVKVAEAGKGLLVEKPVALSGPSWERIFAEFRKRCLPIMDGVMFMHHERLGELKATMEAAQADGGLDSGATRVSSGFSFPADDEWLATNIRTDPSLDALGALGDLGWYQARFALWAFGWDPPARVRAVCMRHVERGSSGGDEASGASAASGGAGSGSDASRPWIVTAGSLPDSGAVPTDLSCSLEWSDGRAATFDCSFHHVFRQWTEVAGKAGSVTMDDFVIARGPAGVDLTVRREASPVKDHREVEAETVTTTAGAGCIQEARMFDAMAGLVRACRLSRDVADGKEVPDADWPAAFWAEASLATQQVMDAAMVSMRAGGAPQDLSGMKRPTSPSEVAGSWSWLMGPKQA